MALHFEEGAAFPRERERIPEPERTLRDAELADAVEGGPSARGWFEPEELCECELGDEVGVLRADEVGPHVRQLHLGAEHVELRDRAGLEAVLLILELILLQLHGLLGDLDERAVQEHVVKLGAGLRDDPIDGVAQRPVAVVLGEPGDAQRGLHLAAGVEHLLHLQGDSPRLVIDAAAAALRLADRIGDALRDGLRRSRVCGGRGRAAGASCTEAAAGAPAAAAFQQRLVLLIVGADRCQVRQRLRPHFDDLPSRLLDGLERLEDFGILLERDLHGAVEREIAGEGTGGDRRSPRMSERRGGEEEEGEGMQERASDHLFWQ